MGWLLFLFDSDSKVKCNIPLLFIVLDIPFLPGYNNKKEKGSASMTINEYQELAMTTLNPELTEKDILINGVMGLCGESGEAIDIVKKWLAQGHELDKEKLAKELGDICWYLAETTTALGLKLEDIMTANIEKLKKRYPQGFDVQCSINRTE